MKYAGHFTVEDASGCQFSIHEYQDRRLLKEVRRLVLDTGEQVQALDERTFELPTGEKLVRVADGA